MKIVVIGTRGFPDIPGGVETHCEELFPRIAAIGHDVTVIRRSSYVNDKNNQPEYRGVKLVDVYAPKHKSLEAIVHSVLAVLKAKRLKADILHVHAIGPALVVPMARLLGMKVVMTNHGPDYNRQKWGRLAKAVLKVGERFGTRFSHQVVVISDTIAHLLADNYGRKDTNLIFNGVNSPEIPKTREFLDSHNIKRPYIFAAGRFVKEKGFHDLVEAYQKSGLSGQYQLVIAGDSDHPDEYSEGLKRQANKAGVVLTGYVKGAPLAELMANAALFVLPSYHEGLPIVLLEAMSYKRDVLASDIPANMIKELDRKGDFFHAGDVGSLAEALLRKLSSPQTSRTYDLSAYDWDSIARQTVDVYERALR